MNIVDEDETPVLHLAAENGQFNIVNVLLENSADVNCWGAPRWTQKTDVDKENGRHFTTQPINGHVDVVKVLLQNGADVDPVDTMKISALCLAAANGHAEVVKVLIQNGRC